MPLLREALWDLGGQSPTPPPWIPLRPPCVCVSALWGPTPRPSLVHLGATLPAGCLVVLWWTSVVPGSSSQLNLREGSQKRIPPAPHFFLGSSWGLCEGDRPQYWHSCMGWTLALWCQLGFPKASSILKGIMRGGLHGAVALRAAGMREVSGSRCSLHAFRTFL